MGFFTDLYKAWKSARAEKEWQKMILKKPDNSKLKEMQAAKETATAKGEPWVEILSMHINPNNLSDGAFELDWNEIFVARLVKKGYSGKNDQVIVEQWFQSICENVVASTYEQEMADPDKRRRIQKHPIDDGKAEYL